MSRPGLNVVGDAACLSGVTLLRLRWEKQCMPLVPYDPREPCRTEIGGPNRDQAWAVRPAFKRGLVGADVLVGSRRYPDYGGKSSRR